MERVYSYDPAARTGLGTKFSQQRDQSEEPARRPMRTRCTCWDLAECAMSAQYDRWSPHVCRIPKLSCPLRWLCRTNRDLFHTVGVSALSYRWRSDDGIADMHVSAAASRHRYRILDLGTYSTMQVPTLSVSGRAIFDCRKIILTFFSSSYWSFVG